MTDNPENVFKSGQITEEERLKLIVKIKFNKCIDDIEYEVNRYITGSCIPTVDYLHNCVTIQTSDYGYIKYPLMNIFSITVHSKYNDNNQLVH